MVNHEVYKANKVLKLCNNIYCIGSEEGNKFVVDAVVIGGNYPTVSRLSYLDIYEGMGDKKEIAELFEKITLQYWDVINLIFEGFNSGRIQLHYCEDEDDDVNLEFPSIMGMYIITNKGDFVVPAPIWTKFILETTSQYKDVYNKSVNPSMRVQVFRRDRKCLCCGKSIKDNVTLEVDLIVPMSKGGKPEIDNMQTLCTDCHIGNLENRFDFLH